MGGGDQQGESRNQPTKLLLRLTWELVKLIDWKKRIGGGDQQGGSSGNQPTKLLRLTWELVRLIDWLIKKWDIVLFSCVFLLFSFHAMHT